jgi:spermidine/putrescine transport system substrate-binding protein
VLGAAPGADIARTIRYPTPNEAALALMPDSYRKSPVIFPPAAALATCEYSRYRGQAVNSLYEAAMTQVRAA